jgi:hypothetical protein
MFKLQNPVLGVDAFFGPGLGSPVKTPARASHDFDEIVVTSFSFQFLAKKKNFNVTLGFID